MLRELTRVVERVRPPSGWLGRTWRGTGGRTWSARSAVSGVMVAGVAVLTVLAPVVGGLAVPASGATPGSFGTGDATDQDTTVVERSRGDGTVYQTGRITDAPDSVDPPAQPTVTGEITTEIDDAEDNIVYAVVGYANGEVLETTRMDGLGSGTVTTGVEVGEDPMGTHLVWTFYAVTSAADAGDAFEREAGAGKFVDGDKGIVFATLDGNESGGGGGESPLSADFSVEQTGPVVTVTASGAGSEDSTIESYEWDFDDGATAEGVSATHTYGESGNYTITLTVTDDRGRTATAERSVKVGESDEGETGGGNETTGGENETSSEPDLRSIAYGETKTGFVDEDDPFDGEVFGGYNYEPVTFSGSEGDIVSATTDASEDGRFPSVRVHGPSGRLERTETGEFVLPEDGEYTIRVGFLSGGTGEYDLTLTRKGGEAPTVTFETGGDLAVDREATVSATASGDDAIESYEWEFGDGATAEGAEATHYYTNPGNYTVTVTVTDEQADTATASREVEVETKLQYRFDDNDDGVVDMDELQDALKEVKRGGDSDLSLEDIREKIEELNGGGGDGDEGDDGDSESDDTDGESDDTDGDGIPDEREEKGIPVLSAFEYSEAGEGANITDPPENDYPQIVLDNVVWLQTDPNEADTDGDGLDDDVEIAEKLTYDASEQPWIPSSYDGNVTLYLLNSDPTDPNTDDAGLADGKEGKVGSDPKTPEYISVNAVTPVFAKDGCDPGEPPEANNCIDSSLRGDDADAGIKIVDEFNNRDGKDPDDKAWLQELVDSKIEDDHTYYLLSVTITADAKNVPEDVKNDVSILFTGLGHYSSTIIGAGPEEPGKVRDSWLFEPWEDGEDGQMTAYLAVRSAYERDDPRWQDLGTLTMEVNVPDSPYARGGGEETVAVTSGRDFAVNDGLPLTSRGEAQQLVAEGTRKFAKGVISASFPATAGGIGSQAFYHLTGRAAAGTLITAEGAALFTDINNKGYGPDDYVGAQYAGEGAVPTYLENGEDRPTTGYVIAVHRAN